MAPFPRGTLRPARPPALRAPLDSRPPRSGGLRRRYDEPLAAATASRRPTDRHRPPPLLQSPGPVGALGGTNGRGQRRMDSPSAPGPCRFPGRCRRRDLGGRCLGAAPFWRTGAHRSWLWQPPSPRAWARQLSAQPRATGTAGSSDRDRRTLRPRPQSARSGVVGQFEIMEACRSRASWVVSWRQVGARPPDPAHGAPRRRLSWLPLGSPFSFRLGQLSRAGGLNAQPGRDTPQYGVVGAALEIGAWRVWGVAAC